MNFFHDIRRCMHPADQIRILHADLLLCIDISRLVDPSGTQRGDVYQQTQQSRSFKLLSSFHSVIPRRYFQTSSNENDEQKMVVLQQELTAAFRMMAATRSGDDKSGDWGKSLLWNENSDEATRLAIRLEKQVVQIIREIGELVRNSGHPKENVWPHFRDDDTFAYFCEKAILALLVFIVKDKPDSLSGKSSGKKLDCFLHGVVWTARVKAQVLQSVGMLILGARNVTILYYLLSQHCLNQLILSMLPLSQWTDPAAEIMLPAFADLLKSLALQLGGSPDLFPLFIIQHKGKEVIESFPLFLALIQMTTSVYAQSDSYVYATCLNLVTGLMRIADASVRECICQLDREQRFLCNHITKLLLERYRRISDLTKGPVVDSVRSNAMFGQVHALDDLIGAVNDVFSCNIDVLNVRLCEILLQRFVAVLLRDLLPGDVRKFIKNAGVSDYDVIPDLEATAQASTVVLSHLIRQLEYGPLLRMIYVAFLHPTTSTILINWKPKSGDNIRDYALTRALNATVLRQGCDTVSNPYRNCILETLAGNFGEWRAASASVLLENVLKSMDPQILVDLELLPPAADETEPSTTDLEDALVLFLERQHSCSSEVSKVALECASSLAMQYLYRVAGQLGNHVTISRQVSLWKVRLLSALQLTKQYFYDKTLEFHHATQVDAILIDVVEAEVKKLYRRCTKIENGVHSEGFVYHLPNHGTSLYGCGAEPLVRKLRRADLNDVETTRFYASMALHFRAVCNVAERVVLANEESPSADQWLDEAGDLTTVFGCLLEQPHVGTDLDLHGRMTFPFTVRATEKQMFNCEDLDTSERRHTFFEEMLLEKSAELLLVMDPTDMFVVKPFPGQHVNHGAIICTIPLVNVVASASDDERLHVAVRHDNVGFLIKNGNLLLTFDTPGTCLIVAQYLGRSRSVLRKELCEKIVTLFTKEKSTSAREDKIPCEETLPPINPIVVEVPLVN